MLTDTACKTAKPREKPYKLAAGSGLFLQVMPNGARYWRARYMFQGKHRLLALGVYPEVSLKEAREKWSAARRKSADPAASRREGRRRKLIADHTFASVARAWHQLHVNKKKLTEKHAAQVLRSLEVGVFPVLGKRPVAEVAPAEVLEVVHAIEARAPETAARVLQRIVNVFDFAVVLGLASVNPAARLRKFLQDRNRGRQAALPAHRMGEFLRALSVYRGDPETREAIRFLVLTLSRTSEVLGARWAEIDFDRALWTVPLGRMKYRRKRRRDEGGSDLDHLVPLSRQALTLLRGLQPLTGRNEFVFPGRPAADGSSRALSNDTLRLGFRRMGFAEGEGTIHGLRATASTVLNGVTKPDADGHPLRLFHPDWIEMALAHRVKDPVRGAYNRALYLDERRAMLQWWADYLDAAREESGSSA